MANFYEDNKDLQFYIDKAIDWESIVKYTEYNFGAEDGFTNAADAVEFYKEILSMVGKLSAEEIAPLSREIDELGHKFEKGEVIINDHVKKIFEKINELGLAGLSLPREVGGMNAPFTLYFAVCEILSRGDGSIMTHYGFHIGIALALMYYSFLEGTTDFETNPPSILKTRWQEEIGEIISGQAWGSMDITEPDAGSDMAALKTYAEQDKDGNWFVTGEKIFITSGHGKYHVCIAKTDKSDSQDAYEGLKKLSLFLVPAWEDDENGNRKRFIELGGLEKKLGIHGSATVTCLYDKSPAQLIGNPGDGFKLMLLIMNNARISVGFESLGLSMAAYEKAKEYAAVRTSMGKTIDRHEMVYDYLDQMNTEIQAIRALGFYAAHHEEMAQRSKVAMETIAKNNPAELEILEKQYRHHTSKSREATPLLKFISSEKSVEHARMCVQIHGGMGYIRETGAEKLLRDSVIFPIYEGTSQIQALMAMKDGLLGIIRKPQEFLQNVVDARRRTLIGSSLERRVARMEVQCNQALQLLMTRVASDKISTLGDIPMGNWMNAMTKDWNPKTDFAPAMLHAENLTIMLCDALISKVLLAQVKKFPERAELLERWLERAELRSEYHFKLIKVRGERILAELENLNQAAERADTAGTLNGAQANPKNGQNGSTKVAGKSAKKEAAGV